MSELNALASIMERSRNYVVNQALEQYLRMNAWQVERITAGQAAARDGRVRDAEAVFAEIAAERGWRA